MRKEYKRNKLTKLLIKQGGWLFRHKPLYYFLNLTWGIVMNIVGLVVIIYMLLTFHKPRIYRGVLYFRARINASAGVTFGGIFVVSKDVKLRPYCQYNELFNHELGHTVQNAILGPFMIFVSLASFVRYWILFIKDNWENYDDIWFEDSATAIGEYGL